MSLAFQELFSADGGDLACAAFTFRMSGGALQPLEEEEQVTLGWKDWEGTKDMEWIHDLSGEPCPTPVQPGLKGENH